MAQDPLFTTLGLFIIDENQYPESWNREPEYNIIGGGASYALIGARFASGPDLGKRVCAIIDKGSDFPVEVEDEINSWGTGTLFRLDASRLTTRGANIYAEDGVRSFVYRAPKKRIFGEDVLSTGNLADLRSFHFCCSVERCEETIDLFLAHQEKSSQPKPLFIFEPFPDVCIAENMETLKKMLHKVDVFSPNLHEAAGFAGLSQMPQSEDEIKQLAQVFLEHTSPAGGIALRCGELGCYVLTRDLSIMLPAYHHDQSNVVDVTGGGNSFCGAFVTALTLSNDWLIAGIIGSLASGCVIESLGMPKLDEGELWNNKSVKDRFKLYVTENSSLLEGVNISTLSWL